jgi:hypothetical protein
MSAFPELKESCETATKKLAGVASRMSSAQASPDELKQLNAEATRLQRDAESSLRKLETEAKGSAPTVRRTLLDTISTLKAGLAKARADVQKANDNAARGELLGGKGKSEKMEGEARDKLAAAADKASS